MKNQTKNTLVKLASLGLAAMTTVSLAAGCNVGSGTGTNNGKTTLTIRVANTGFGVDCVKKVAEAFAQIKGINVDVKATVAMKDDLNKLIADYKMEDIFFVSGTEATEVIRQKKFAQIDDVWTSTPDGETQTVKEKTFDIFAEDYKAQDGHYYSIPFETQLGGMAYNKETLDTVYGVGQWELPTTSDELTSMAEEISKKGNGEYWGVTFTTSMPYWEGLHNTWVMQYHGMEEYTKLISGEYKTTDGTWEFSQSGECLDQMQGVLRSYEAMYPMINKDNGIASEYCEAMGFMEMQVSFAGLGYGAVDKRKVAFTPSGSWLYNENYDDFEYANTTPGFFNVVLSAVVEKLSFYEETGTDYYSLTEGKRARYDKALSEIIAYVDGKTTTKPATANGYTVTDEDIAKVKEARFTRYINNQPNAGITHNSTNIELAKEFLVFYASDYAAEIYSANTHGVSPFAVEEYTVTEDSAQFDKDVKALLSGDINLVPSCEHQPYGSLIEFSIEGSLFNNSNKDINTPAALFANKFVKNNENSWKRIVRESGNADKLTV